MKKDFKRITLDLSPKAFTQLDKKSKALKKSRTRYIEDLLNFKVKKNEICTIEKILTISEQHKSIYYALNSTISNINQIVYLIHSKKEQFNSNLINNIFTEIIRTKESTKELREIIQRLNDNINILLINNKTFKSNIQQTHKADEILNNFNKTKEEKNEG